jgi:hypothetical protein
MYMLSCQDAHGDGWGADTYLIIGSDAYCSGFERGRSILTSVVLGSAQANDTSFDSCNPSGDCLRIPHSLNELSSWSGFCEANQSLFGDAWNGALYLDGSMYTTPYALVLPSATSESGDCLCRDVDFGAVDSYGDGCFEYALNPGWCFIYDDEQFISGEMCCVCDGGRLDL